MGIDPNSPSLKQVLDQEDDVSVDTMDRDEAEYAMRSGDLDAWISIHNGTPTVLLEGSEPSMNQRVMVVLQKAFQRTAAQGIELEVDYFYGSEDLSNFDNFGPVLIGFITFFFVFLIAGVSFLRERTGGTLERLMASPIQKWEVVVGYLLGFGIFTGIQSTIIILYSIYVLDLLMVGDFIWVLVITLLSAFTALSLGMLLSAYAQNELQIIQFIPLVIVPQVFFSGLFDLRTISDWVSWIGPITPLYYAADGLRDVMIRGQGFAEIALDLFVLLGLSVVFSTANIAALRKYRSF